MAHARNAIRQTVGCELTSLTNRVTFLRGKIKVEQTTCPYKFKSFPFLNHVIVSFMRMTILIAQNRVARIKNHDNYIIMKKCHCYTSLLHKLHIERHQIKTRQFLTPSFVCTRLISFIKIFRISFLCFFCVNSCQHERS